jgi:sarcosine oxidase subunit alpha
MTSFRLDGFGRIDRSRPVRFSFDGREVSGFTGDSVATALLANGIAVVGRSFKYHRPRGVWGFGVEEPNAIVDIRGSRIATNGRATTEAAADGLVVRSVNASPNAEHDRGRFLDLFHRFMPSGFYYKTFMIPTWHLFEPGVRAMAGFGRVDPTIAEPRIADQVNAACDLLVIGAGPSGLVAARAAAEAGRRVMLCDEQSEPGGSLLHRDATDRKSTRLNSSHNSESRMPSSA